ncbi:hypothetical protein BCR44DRAFT_1441338 [Catenaria anguillulae PL171]|uniref:Tyrosinase copper-binding domain-containing protein n=1 Tax=Catenaria anguillulae PL171 TaxID=765915 RepID=A0A1Y2HBG1_9FUNG|nr:hypothetical protein BCR44DRAFT_1441338 [Catenaria anguillulae PL171]
MLVGSPHANTCPVPPTPHDFIMALRSRLLVCLLVVALAAVLIPIPVAHAVAPTCVSPRLRKEIRDLSDNEFAAYTRGMNELKRTGRITQYVAIHQQWTQQAHGGVLFLAWHRRFIYQLETELLAITGPALSGLPYFDPFQSYSVFDPSHPRFIGEAQGCVTSGPFRGWISSEGRCLMRALNTSPTFVDPRAMTQLILGDAAFSDFAGTYENGQHADVHSAIGGQMVGLMYSVNDPAFFLHHAHVDQVWYRRQYADTGRLYWDYSGMHTPGGVGQVTLNTPIPPWQDPVGVVATYAQQPASGSSSAASTPTPSPNQTPPTAATGPALQRRQLHSPPTSTVDLRIFNFTHTDPLHRCTPLPAAKLAPMGISPADAQAAFTTDRKEAWIMPHDIGKDERVPSAWVMSNGRVPKLNQVTGFEVGETSGSGGEVGGKAVEFASRMAFAVVVGVGMTTL